MIDVYFQDDFFSPSSFHLTLHLICAPFDLISYNVSNSLSNSFFWYHIHIQMSFNHLGNTKFKDDISKHIISKLQGLIQKYCHTMHSISCRHFI